MIHVIFRLIDRFAIKIHSHEMLVVILCHKILIVIKYVKVVVIVFNPNESPNFEVNAQYLHTKTLF